MTFYDPAVAEEFASEHPNPVVVLTKGMEGPSLAGVDYRSDANFLCAFSGTVVTPHVFPRNGLFQFRVNAANLDKMLVALFSDIPGAEVVVYVYRRNAPDDPQRDYAGKVLTPQQSMVEKVRADIRRRDYLRMLDSAITDDPEYGD